MEGRVWNVILDCDPGIDDAMAILLLFGIARMNRDSGNGDIINIIGITITHGNLGRDDGVMQLARNACRVLQLIEECSSTEYHKKETRIPVVIGSTTLLNGEGHDGAPFVHGNDGLGDGWVDFDGTSDDSVKENVYSRILNGVVACDWIIEKAKEHSDIVLITLGPLTNIALCLRKDKEFTSRIKAVYTMGGALNIPGNVSEVSEANIYHDPLAANEVFSSDLTIYLAPLNLTRQLNFNRETVIHHLITINPLVGLFILHVSKFYLDFFKKGRCTDLAYVHDSTAVALFLIPEIFSDWKNIWIRVETESSLTLGMTVADLRGGSQNIKKYPCNIRLAGKANASLFQEKYALAMKALCPSPSAIPSPLRRRFVMCMGGAFNPVHSKHVEVMDAAKTRLEEEFGYGCVLAGYFAVSADGYVKGKLKNQAMKGIHRLEMSRLATLERYWMVPSSKTFASAPELLLKLFPKYHGIDLVIVTGGDRAKVNKALEKKNFYSVIIGRKGYTEQIQRDFGQGNTKKKKVLFVDKEVGDVSSSQIRQVLGKVHSSSDSEEKKTLLSGLVENGSIHQLVADYLLANESDLYL